MVQRQNVTETVTEEMAATPQFQEMNLAAGETFERPETDEEVAERDPEAKLVEDTVTEQMIADDGSFAGSGLKVGDKFQRLETDEERAIREGKAPEAGDVCQTEDGKPGKLQADAGGHLVCIADDAEKPAEEKVEETIAQGPGTPEGGGVNGARHPLA